MFRTIAIRAATKLAAELHVPREDQSAFVLGVIAAREDGEERNSELEEVKGRYRHLETAVRSLMATHDLWDTPEGKALPIANDDDIPF